jgi:hypothetical protein
MEWMAQYVIQNIESAMSETTGQSAGRAMPPYWLVVYALAVPVVIGLISGVNEGGSARMVSKEWYILRYVFRGLLSWWASIAVMFALAAILKPWNLRFITLLLITPIITIVLNAPLSLVWQPLFEPYLAEGSQFYPLWPWRYTDPDYVTEGILALLTNEVVWVSFNLALWRGLGFRLYGFPPPAVASHTTLSPADEPGASLGNPVPAFFDRLPADIGKEIVALEAQEHYTKVHTAEGTALILYRFGDAVKEMAPGKGLQVHRSFWVSSDAIAAVDRSGRSYELNLKTGLKVPVSRSYKVKVDELDL